MLYYFYHSPYVLRTCLTRLHVTDEDQNETRFNCVRISKHKGLSSHVFEIEDYLYVIPNKV